MDGSILTTTKKVLGLSEEYTAFDLDILTFINTAFADLNQLGVGPADGFVVEDETAQWYDISLPARELSIVKTFVFLKVRMLFDPPTTSFLIGAMEKQLDEYAWRLTAFRDEVAYEAG